MNKKLTMRCNIVDCEIKAEWLIYPVRGAPSEYIYVCDNHILESLNADCNEFKIERRPVEGKTMERGKLLEMAEKDPYGLMVMTLREIAEIKGEFSLDPHTHALNTIRNMQKLAITTLFAIHEISEDKIKKLELGQR